MKTKIICAMISFCLGFTVCYFSVSSKKMKNQNSIKFDKKDRLIMYTYPNQDHLPLTWASARWSRNELRLLHSPYSKSKIDSLLKGLNAVSFVDNNKCGVFLMGWFNINLKSNLREDFYITPDTIYLIDTYRPVLFKYIVKNDKGGYDTLNELP